MADSMHILEDELMALLDDEVTAERGAAVKSHLASCSECRGRSIELQRGRALYTGFHQDVLRPALEPSAWPPLQLKRRGKKASVWWVTAVAACLLLGAMLFVSQVHSQQQSHRMTALLDRAESVQAPAGEQIRMRMNGVSLMRPAVLMGNGGPDNIGNIRALFVRANFDWRDPLSARSFAGWRRTLRHKRDHVSATQMDSGAPAYLVRTDTTDSYLRSASLTIRREDLASVRASLQFENEPAMEIEDRGQIAPKKPVRQPRSEPITADDELRVLAALDEIGADVDDAVTVKRDPAQNVVVVTGIGVRPPRQEEIRRKLAALPHALVTFLSHESRKTSGDGAVASGEPNAESKAILEARAGGAEQFEAVATKASDISSALLARAHALDSLAESFPAGAKGQLSLRDRSLLGSLRRKHAAQIDQLSLQLSNALESLHRGAGAAETHVAPAASWQSGAGAIYTKARAVDDGVARSLGGFYAPEQTDAILSKLADEIDEVRSLARKQITTR